MKGKRLTRLKVLRGRLEETSSLCKDFEQDGAWHTEGTGRSSAGSQRNKGERWVGEVRRQGSGQRAFWAASGDFHLSAKQGK